MTDLIGTWDITMRTPIGTMRATMMFSDENGRLVGAAEEGSERIPLRDLRVEVDASGERVRWSQTITKPMRLALEFDVTVEGAQMNGSSQAGRLPRTSVRGVRRGA